MFNGRHRGGCTTWVCARTAAHGTAHPQGPCRAREQHHPQWQPLWNRDSKPWLTTSVLLLAPTESGGAISPAGHPVGCSHSLGGRGHVINDK